uniref:Uncharacterized protein n=1 Tax=Chrysotila carterae TaxID=13221 RepID=A0A7S4FCF5_CHRCT
MSLRNDRQKLIVRAAPRDLLLWSRPRVLLLPSTRQAPLSPYLPLHRSHNHCQVNGRRASLRDRCMGCAHFNASVCACLCGDSMGYGAGMKASFNSWTAIGTSS